MTGPIIPAGEWPEDAHLHTWDSNGLGNWLRPSYGAWHLWATDIPLPPGHDWRVPVMRSQPAPAIDLEQFRMLAQGSIDALSQNKVYPADVSAAISSMRHLLALIDGQAVCHPEGTPRMPAGRFYDGCWTLATEGVRHHARMLTQSWRVVDSSELKRALEAGVLALIDGQKAAPRGPDQPDLCDLCRVREKVRSDAEGIPFCQECWDGWQSEEAKQQPTKGEGE